MILAQIRTHFADAFFPRWAEWVAAGTIFMLGWMLSVNDNLMATSTGKGYHLMLEIASQPTWAVALAIFGLMRLLVLLINGLWRRSPWARAISAVFSCFFWTQITLSFAPIFGFAFILAGGFLLMDLVNIVRAMRDARTVDDAYARRRGNAG